MLSQIVFGEAIEVLDIQNNWAKVRTFYDHYEGWLDVRLYYELSDKEMRRWLDGLEFFSGSYVKLKTESGFQEIIKGAFLPANFEDGFRIGNHFFTLEAFEKSLFASQKEFALSYLNAPYLWGGKSPFGLDCSGYMQQVFRWNGINLPRDAYQQQELGEGVSRSESQGGDLAFFANEAGKITHVGYLFSPNEIIHASGWVRIDRLTDEGIVNEAGVLTHRLHSIKRI